MADSLRSITVPLGFRAAGVRCGIKASGKADLMLLAADAPCHAAAVFTRSAIPSQAVIIGQRHMRGGKLQAVVVNSGNANASTGAVGLANAVSKCERVAEHLGCRPADVLPSSTGLIGQPLPIDKVLRGIDLAAGQLRRGSKADADAAAAIMTTDTRPKASLRRVELGSGKRAGPIVIGGIAKGSGMIAPNMGTMLAYITTDAAIDLPLLRDALRDAVDADASFNRISVDSDTSPSDTVVVMASGAADAPPITTRGKAYRAFADALREVCVELAYKIIADGEGMTKIMRVIVERAKSADDAVKVARAIVDSPLVKTAVHGGDPNWGRITMAVGKSGAAVKPEKLAVSIGPIVVYRAGAPTNADLPTVETLMRQSEVAITVDMGLGKHRCEYLGCDLSRDYITINADYST